MKFLVSMAGVCLFSLFSCVSDAIAWDLRIISGVGRAGGELQSRVNGLIVSENGTVGFDYAKASTDGELEGHTCRVPIRSSTTR